MADTSVLKTGSVCVVGSVNRDIKIAGLRATAALFEDGETSVPGVIETIGGGGANSACAACALGGKAIFVGKTGADALGERLTEAMRRHGLDVRLKKDASCPTGSTVVLGYESGHRHFVSCLPNNESLSWEDLDLTALDGCDHLLRADPWFSKSMLADGNERLFREARRRGLATSLDVNWDPCWGTGPAAEIAGRKRQLRSVLPLVDVVHGNLRELTTFADVAEPDSALRQITAWGARAVVVHLGSRGAGYYCDGRLVEERPAPARKIQNATGAGDVLSICMILLHRRRDMTVSQKLRFANDIVTEFIEGRRILIPTL